MEWGEPPIFPSLLLPEAPTMPAPVLEVPRAQIPSYKPLVVPPSDLRPPPGIKGDGGEKEEINLHLNRYFLLLKLTYHPKLR